MTPLLNTLQQRLPLLFNGPDNPKLAPTVTPIQYMVPWAQVSPHTGSRSVEPFLHSTVMSQHTDRQTDHATCAMCNHTAASMQCVHAMRPNNNNLQITSNYIKLLYKSDYYYYY